MQELEKELYGTQLRLREVEQREQSCIQEIHTLERHIDHITHQYELAQQSINQAKDEQHQLLNDI